MTGNEPQPWIDEWPLSQFNEALSKLPCLADIETARIKLARRFNSKRLPREIEVDLAWKEHRRTDPLLVRPHGAKLPEAALRFIAEAARVFPGCEKDLILVRHKGKASE